eukprot:scaffold49639_cov63-Phaeocystis_antarctica.AAC.1
MCAKSKTQSGYMLGSNQGRLAIWQANPSYWTTRTRQGRDPENCMLFVSEYPAAPGSEIIPVGVLGLGAVEMTAFDCNHCMRRIRAREVVARAYGDAGIR